jgi:MSHA pilin protein MshC
VRKKKEPTGSFFCLGERGFTVPELVAVLLIVGVLAAVAVPRFSTISYGQDELRFYEQTLAALRHAQNTAVTTQRTVCAVFTGTTLVLRYAPSYGTATCLSTDGVKPPGGGSAPYTVTAQGNAGYSSTPSNFNYDRSGRPVDNGGAALGQTIAFIGGKQIVIEVDTGYAR